MKAKKVTVESRSLPRVAAPEEGRSNLTLGYSLGHYHLQHQKTRQRGKNELSA